MNKASLLVVVLLALPQPGAGEEMKTYVQGVFSDGSLVFVAGDSVTVRQKPAMNAPILDRLPIGYQLTVMSKSGPPQAAEGLAAPWYQVRYSTEQGERTGHLWGGSIAMAALPISYNGQPAILLVSARGVKAAGRLQMQAMVVNEFKVVSSVIFNAIGTTAEDGTYPFTVVAGIRGGRGFTGIDSVIVLDFEYDKCRMPFGRVVLMSTGSRLLKGVEAVSTHRCGSSLEETALIFPDEKGGRPDSLVRVETVRTWSESLKRYTPTSMRRTVHAWAGGMFTGW